MIHESDPKRGALIVVRARAGSAVHEARSRLHAIPPSNRIDRLFAKSRLDDALAAYGEALWAEEKYTR